jgi:hypothetical protein
MEVTEEVFAFVLQMACERKLISGTQVGVDATLLEANAAMKSIVRRDTHEDWKAYLKRLMAEAGLIAKAAAEASAGQAGGHIAGDRASAQEGHDTNFEEDREERHARRAYEGIAAQSARLTCPRPCGS